MNMKAVIVGECRLNPPTLVFVPDPGQHLSPMEPPRQVAASMCTPTSAEQYCGRHEAGEPNDMTTAEAGKVVPTGPKLVR